jgi:hypothetical protein
MPDFTRRSVLLVATLGALFGPGCSAVISPDPGLLDPDGSTTRDAGNGMLDGARPGDDTGIAPGTDTGVGPGTDSGVDPGVDAFVPPGDDAGTTDVDAFVGADAFVPPPRDGGAVCMPGVECSGYDTALEAAPTGATSLDNCVVQMHQLDCCGAMAAYGVNHAARTTLCPAEASCDAQYPAATCTDSSIVTDTGDTTNRMTDVRLRLVDPAPCPFNPALTCYTCETFVCRSDTCRSAPGISGGCGP